MILKQMILKPSNPDQLSIATQSVKDRLAIIVCHGPPASPPCCTFAAVLPLQGLGRHHAHPPPHKVWSSGIRHGHGPR